MSRYQASLIHLTISLVVVSIVFSVVFFVWYPKPAFEVVGASSIVRLLIGVDLVLGPLLTLVVYKHGKPGLRFDLSVIAILQVVALLYGSYRLYEEKPQYLVFAVDRLEFVSKKQVDESAIRYDELRIKPFAKLIPVFARRPEDQEEFQRFLDSVVIEGQPDLERRAEYWEPWAAGTDEIRHRIRPLSEFNSSDPREREIVRQAIDRYTREHPGIGVLPIGAVD
jgi:hypothetical protein